MIIGKTNGIKGLLKIMSKIICTEHRDGYLFHPEILHKDKPLSEFEGSGFHIRQDEVTIRYSLSIPDTRFEVSGFYHTR